MKQQSGDADTRRQTGEKVPDVSASAYQPPPIITLLTDFGTRDYFVAAVKGVILTVNPNARLVDITHEIPPQDIEAAAFTLLAAASTWPDGAIHLAVVDPGVGSERRPLLIQRGTQFFVGPDNGIFSYVCERYEEAGATPRFFHITNEKYFRSPVSTTFHGRDIFAPVAAALSLGVEPAAFGDEVTHIVRLPRLRPAISPDGRLTGRIIHIDRFGNCITNLTQNDLPSEKVAAGFELQINGHQVGSLRRYFSEIQNTDDEVFAIWGGADFLELASANQSAAKILKAQRGDQIVVATPAR